jgi:hypothetical protein
MQRIKDSLTSTLNKLRQQIETTHKNGKIPADYSLGFTNALIFMDHRLNMRDGEPKFYDRTTSIGTLPKPVALNSGQALKDEQTYQFLQDCVMLRSRQVLDSLKIDDENKTIDITDATLAALVEMKQAIEQMDKFVTERLEMEDSKNGKQETAQEQQKDQPTEGTESSSNEELRAI